MTRTITNKELHARTIALAPNPNNDSLGFFTLVSRELEHLFVYQASEITANDEVLGVSDVSKPHNHGTPEEENKEKLKVKTVRIYDMI